MKMSMLYFMMKIMNLKFKRLLITLLCLLSSIALADNSLRGLSGFENHKINAFMTGLLAVIIATPCTAPFMGAAIAYALMMPVYIYFPIFFTLGLGYALPFALLAWNPLKIKRILPKPGKWMSVLKKILSIPLIFTCIWLMWVLLAQLGIIFSGKNLSWQDYSSDKVSQAIENKQPVFIDFTAKWCITCMVNKQAALQSDDLANIVKEKNILLLRADATNKDEKITIKAFDIIKKIGLYGPSGNYDEFKQKYPNFKIGNMEISKELYNKQIEEIQLLIKSFNTLSNEQINLKGGKITIVSEVEPKKELKSEIDKKMIELYRKICAQNKGFSM